LEERANQTYSLQEHRYERAAQLRNMPNRQAILRLPEQPAQQFRTTTVTAPLASPEAIRSFNRHALETSPYTRPLDVIDAELNMRQSRLEARIETRQIGVEPKRFRERRKAPVIDG
jgi:hypothetical protein